MANDANQTAPNSEDILFATSRELSALSAQMVSQARRSVDIVSRFLEPAVYDTQNFVEAMQRLVVSGRGRAKVRILVLDPAALVSYGNHRVVDLCMKVSSYMEIRRPGPDHQDFNEAMLIVDGKAMIHRKLSDRYEGIANFHAPRRAEQLLERFEALWQQGEPDTNFRRLML
jgi:hypothetical protein